MTRSDTSWRRELLLAVALGTAIFVLTMVPYVVGYLTAPTGKVFNGFFFLGDDGSSYIAEIRAGANGAWAWSDPYISKPIANPVLLFMFYVLTGKLAGLAHVPVFVAFHLARLSGAIVLVFAVRRLAAATLPAGRVRTIAVVLALFGSGAGYLLALAGVASGQGAVLGQPLAALDLHIPEISGFFTVMTFPHFTWAAALMALAVVELMTVASAPNGAATAVPALRAGLYMLGLTMIHPQMVVVLGVLLLAMLLAFRTPVRRWPTLALPFLVCLPLFSYYLYILTSDPVVSAYVRQWQQGPYPVLPTLFAFGLPLALAVVAIVRGHLRQRPRLLVLAGWVGLVLLLLYLPSPVSIQRRLFDGIFLPMGLLAAVGVDVVARRARGVLGPRRLATYLVAATTLTSGLMVVVPISIASSRAPEIYLDVSEARAMDWLASGVGTGTPPAVMSVAETGLFIPARSGDRVYSGNYALTIDNSSRGQAAAAAIRSGGDALLGLMHEQGTTYLFVGPRERASGVGPLGPGLNLVYDHDGVQLYSLSP